MDAVDPAARVIDELKMGVAALLAVDPHASGVGGDHERMVDLVGLASMFEAVVSRFAGPWDAGVEWASDRSRSAAARLARDTGCSDVTAKGIVKRAHALRSMPLTEAACSTTLLEPPATGVMPLMRHPMMVTLSGGPGVNETDVTSDAALTLGGTTAIAGCLDPVDGEIFRNELARLDKELFDADWACLSSRVGS